MVTATIPLPPPSSWREHLPLIIIAVGLGVAIYMLYRDLNGLKQSISQQALQSNDSYDTTSDTSVSGSSETTTDGEEDDDEEDGDEEEDDEEDDDEEDDDEEDGDDDEEVYGEDGDEGSVPSYDGRPVSTTQVYDEPSASLVRSNADKKVPVEE